MLSGWAPLPANSSFFIRVKHGGYQTEKGG